MKVVEDLQSFKLLKVETQSLSACLVAEPRSSLFLLKVIILHPLFWFPLLKKIGIGNNPTKTSY